MCHVLWGKAIRHIMCSHSPMKPPLAMLTYSLFFCERKHWISIEGATTPVRSRHTAFTHLQEMCQHHVHIHVLLLSPTSHEAQVLSAGDGAWLQRLLLGLQERLHRESKFRGVLEHLCRRRRYSSRHWSAADSVSFQVCTMTRNLGTWLVFLHGQNLYYFCLTRSESKWKAVDRCPELYCSAGRQSTTKNRTPSWKRDHWFKWHSYSYNKAH